MNGKVSDKLKERLAILHHSFNLLGIVVLFGFLEYKVDDDTLYFMFGLAGIILYGVLSGLLQGEDSKYILFKKSFFIILLLILWVGILGDFLFLDEELINDKGYLFGLFYNFLFSISISLVLILTPFLAGYGIGIIPRLVKYLIKKI